MLCGLNCVGSGSLKKWGKALGLYKGVTPLYDKKIYYLKELPTYIYYYSDTDVDILERIIETFLYIIEYNGKKYKPTLAGYADWYWRNKINVDLNFFYWNKIKTYQIEKRIRSAFYGGVNYVNEKYVGKTVKTIAKDKTSAYPLQLVSKPMPVLEPIECKGLKCMHELSIMSITYFNFKLKNNCLPVLKKRSLVSSYIKEGDIFEYPSIIQEQMLVIKSYSIENYYINWKYCFMSNNTLFIKYFKKFFTMKEMTHPGIIQLTAKILNNSLWGYQAQNLIKNNKIFVKKEISDIKLRINQLCYESSDKNYYWIEEVFNKKDNPEKYFDSKKAKYLPLACYVTGYQRIEAINVGNANYKHVVWIDTDCVTVEDKGQGIKIPKYIDIELKKLPSWCKGINYKKEKYCLGEWKDVEQSGYQKILAPKLYIKFDENKKITNIKAAGVVKDESILEFLNVDDFDFGLRIEDGSTKSTVLPEGGVDIKKSDFNISKKQRSSMF